MRNRHLLFVFLLGAVFLGMLLSIPTPVRADGIIIPDPPICDPVPCPPPPCFSPGPCPPATTFAQLAIRYHRVQVTIEEWVMPTMDEYRLGARPRWRSLHDATFVRTSRSQR
jgi:hypothetical protein